jgi:hypothetical protein
MPDIRTLTLGIDYETNLGSTCLYYTTFTVHLSTFGPAVTFVSAGISSGVPPPGMVPYVCPGASSTLNMVGVPYATGVYTFTVDALMSNGSHQFFDCIHTIALVGGCPLITPTDMALNGKVGIAFSRTMQATGGATPYTWDSAGTLPSGMAISSGGVFSGTPTVAGTYTFTLRATDSGGCRGALPYVMVVDPAIRTQIRGRTQVKLESLDDAQISNTADIKHRKLQGGAIPYIVPDEMFEELPWVPGGSSGSSAGGAVLANGTVPFTADESMGNHKLTSVANPTAAQDAVNVQSAENISVLTNGDPTTPEIMFDATGDVIMTGI